MRIRRTTVVSPEERIKAFNKVSNYLKNELEWYVSYRGRTHNPTFELTYLQYLKLAVKAGLTRTKQIGKASKLFQLGRKGDKGPYSYTNCRFITQRQNLDERRKNGGNLKTSIKLKGRTAKNDDGRALATAKLRGRSKAEHAYLEIQADRQAKSFIAISPSGVQYRDRNLTEFCKIHKLNQGNLSAVFRGERNHNHGWTGYYI